MDARLVFAAFAAHLAFVVVLDVDVAAVLVLVILVILAVVALVVVFIFFACGVDVVVVFLTFVPIGSLQVKIFKTITAWAIFKYCGTKTVPPRIRKYLLINVLLIKSKETITIRVRIRSKIWC